MVMTRTAAALAALMVLAPGGAVASTAPGALDKTFSGDGRAQVGFGGAYDSVQVRDLVVLPTDEVVLVAPLATGSRTVFGVSRLRADGSPDPKFSRDGRRSISLTGRDVPRRAVPAGGGRVLVGGSAGGDFALAMVRRDGSLDPAFGDGGTVVTDVTSGSDQVLDLRRLPNGSILAAGTAGGQFAVARYDATGALDQTFGTGGTVVTTDGFPGTAYTVRLQPDGKLLAAGVGVADAQSTKPMLVTRFAADGSLDQTFGSDGRVTTHTPDGEEVRAYALLVDPEGRILAGGTSDWADYSDNVLVRYLADGTPDPSFGTGGQVVSGRDMYAELQALALQPDGRIVGAGQTSRSGGPGKESTIAVTRYTAVGAVDTTFSGDGVATVGFPDNPITQAWAVGVSDDRIVAAGYRVLRGDNPTYGAVVRLHQ